jgi:hypothetical protein
MSAVNVQSVPFGPRGNGRKVAWEEVVMTVIREGSTTAALPFLPIKKRQVQSIYSSFLRDEGKRAQYQKWLADQAEAARKELAQIQEQARAAPARAAS